MRLMSKIPDSRGLKLEFNYVMLTIKLPDIHLLVRHSLVQDYMCINEEVSKVYLESDWCWFTLKYIKILDLGST